MKKISWLLLVLLYCSTVFSASNFLVMSDIHLDINKQTRMEYAPSKPNRANDIDSQSLAQLFNLIKKNIGKNKTIPKPQFILILGDLAGHDSENIEWKSYVHNNLSHAFEQLRAHFSNIPIIYVFGNNDAVDYHDGNFALGKISPFSIAKRAGFKNGFLSTGMFCNNKRAKLPCIESQNTKEGYFLLKIKPKLVLIVLDSSILSPEHIRRKNQVSQQFGFFEKCLQDAKKNHQSVLIAMHIPLGHNIYDGSPFMKAKDLKQFLNIIKAYHSIISGLLVSHTHMEEFKILRIGKDSIGQYSTPGISTSHGNVPALKTFYINKVDSHWYINDYTLYGIYETKKGLKIKKSYDFSQRYCHTPTVKNINSCLRHIDVNQLRKHITVDNPNYQNYPIRSPHSFVINLD